MTKALFLVIMKILIIFIDGHKNMVFSSTPYPRSNYTVTGCGFTIKVVLLVIITVTSTPPFPRYPSFPLFDPLKLNVFTSSILFK